MPRLSLLSLASAGSILSLATAAPDLSKPPAGLDVCYGEWLECLEAAPCADAMKAVYACFADKAGPAACLAGLDDVTAVPELMTLDACLLEKAGKKFAGIDRLTNIPNVTPAQLWPYVYDLDKYEWTDLVSAKCASKGCNATALAPGDKLTVSVVVLVDKPKVPAAIIPLVKVAEVITNGTCVGLPGKCVPVDAHYLEITGDRAPVYRIEWGPYYGVFGYQHFFDLLEYPSGGPGTTFYHHEYYTGLAGVLFGEALLVPLFTPTIEAQNADMLTFAATLA